MSDTMLTPSVVQDALNQAATQAFLRYKDENRITSDHAAAGRLELKSTYPKWLDGSRSWTAEGIVQVAAGLQCHVEEMLRLVDQGPGR